VIVESAENDRMAPRHGCGNLNPCNLSVAATIQLHLSVGAPSQAFEGCYRDQYSRFDCFGEIAGMSICSRNLIRCKLQETRLDGANLRGANLAMQRFVDDSNRYRNCPCVSNITQVPIL